ncbi:hypothetical protein Tco_0570659 [Tanacetum coccineum]|uniref:Uncharacterized protein n=1 Tax=Tanacetum coccineum TaxID=301880 RepID=A0ABQ5BHW2_9ASTR
MNDVFLLHAMRQHEMEQSKSEPSEYYFHVMHDFRELPRLAIPASGKTRSVSFPFHVSYKLQNPQAIRIILGLGGRDAAGQETDDPFQGYAFEIFLPERLFNVRDAKEHRTECADERAALANLIANLTLDTEENKTILKQLKKANASLTKNWKSAKLNLMKPIVLGGGISCSR